MEGYGAAIATSSKLAADAGATMVEAGGNAADAAVAAALVSAVTEPGVVDLGSGAYATIWPAGEPPVTLDGGVEMSGRGLDEDRFALFCGEMSWGEEPEGDGYQLLKRMFLLGIDQALGIE